MKTYTFVAFALAAATMPAWASPGDQIACFADQVTPAQGAELAQALLADEEPAILSVFDAPLQLCRKRHQWSSEQMEIAATYGISRAMTAEMRQKLVASGQPADKVDSYLAAQIATLQRPENRASASRTLGEALVRMGLVKGAPGFKLSSADKLISYYASNRLMMMLSERDFIAASSK